MDMWVREIYLYTMADFIGLLASMEGYSEGALAPGLALRSESVRDF